MSGVALGAFLVLASQCAPSIAPDTLAAIAKVESGFNEIAVNLNGAGGGTLRPATRAEAVALATDLIVTQRRSVDLGLMQVNSANLPRLSLTIPDAFDPCTNISAGARILREGYTAAAQAEPGQPQRALRVAFSRYNTGHPERGFANGYVRKVEAAAEVVVPAIRLQGVPASPPPPARVPNPEADDPDAPPEWDVWARTTYVRRPRLVAVPLTTPAAEGVAAAVAPESPVPMRIE